MAGCTSASDQDEEPAASTSTPAPSNAVPAGASLCDLIPADDVARFSGDYEPREDLLLGKEAFIGCDADGLSSFEFGLRVVDDGRPLEEYLAGEAEAVEDVGDEAFRVATEFEGEVMGETIIARRGDVVAIVRNELLQDGPERATPEDTREVMALLLTQSVDDVAAIEKVRVADPCPSVEAAAEVIGDVEVARAQPLPDDLDCAYLSGDTVRLLVSRYQVTTPEDTVDADNPVEIDGADRASIREDSSRVSVSALVGDVTWSVEAASVARGGEVSLDRDVLIALAEDVIAAG
ncbi:hypothetical protein [Aeromicrobium sp. CF3.5]|uniref:hypothetical protein n=1 Tax=Aeromicrobium sp. CF3.5 TaxID=3373078 RepID=UPI003EE54611